MNQMNILLVEYPFSNQTEFKIRPVIVVSNNEFNEKHSHILACPITSKKSLKEFEVEIQENEFDGRLDRKSFIRSDSIASIEKDLFIKKIGRITPELFKKLRNKIISNL